ncbi:MAG: FkbM family methyltransferase [Lachnospiraceae bacterium]|jgi:hypothetical protein
MRYTAKESYIELRSRYDKIIGWGAGAEFRKFYDHTLFQFDHMIDGAGRNVGNILNGIMVQGIETVTQYKHSDSLLVVIYPNIENEILQQIRVILPKADTIAARLICIEGRNKTYSADGEDLFMLDYITSKYDHFSYIDIGVCHPVVRNNTYLFYENGFTEGVLVEPNMEMCDMAAVYRPINKIVNMGASPDLSAEKLDYYYDSMHPGLNTFRKDVALQRGIAQSCKKVPVENINSILADNFKTYPNVMDIDTEGLDYELLAHLDFERFPIDLICVEASAGDLIRKLMQEKGYQILKTTSENEIYARM